MARVSKRDKAEAIAELQKRVQPGDTLHTVLRHVSRSGMQRQIDVYKLTAEGPIYLSGYVATALEWNRAANGAIKADGCGMDMGFHLVNSLSYVLHGTKDVGCVDGFRQELKASPTSYRAGYSLRHEWL